MQTIRECVILEEARGISPSSGGLEYVEEGSGTRVFVPDKLIINLYEAKKHMITTQGRDFETFCNRVCQRNVLPDFGEIKFFPKEPGDGIERIPDLRDAGYTLIKQHHMFGRCPTYQHNETKAIVFYHQRRFMTAMEVLEDLREYWRPAAKEEQEWSILHMEKYFNEAAACDNVPG